MKRFRHVTLTAALVALLAGGAAYAQGPGPDGRGMRGPGSPGMFGRGAGLPVRALNLSDAQQEQFRALAQQHRDQNRATAERLRNAFAAQRKAVQTVPFDEQLIRSTTQELAEAQTEAALQRARLRTEMVGLLTPEQQAELQKLQAERANRMQQRQQRRRAN